MDPEVIIPFVWIPIIILIIVIVHLREKRDEKIKNKEDKEFKKIITEKILTLKNTIK